MESHYRKKLVWMCRRGTRELDQIMLHYLETYYDTATAQEQRTFEAMLQLSNPELQELLIYGNDGADQDLNTLATFIRTHYQT